MLPRVTFVLGGAASGKSRLAEDLVGKAGLPRVYVATAEAHDDEMRAKLDAHRAQRGPDWITIEEPLDLARVIGDLPEGHVTLIDCATMWLSNLILAGRDADAGRDALIAALREAQGPLVIVSNEVGGGVVPDNALARRFRNAQGALNQALAAEADLAVAVIAGLPLVLKGRMPG